MALFSKPTEQERALASARSDLAAAQKKRATLAAREDAAAISAEKYAMWCSERDATDTDIARLTKLVAAREASLQEAARTAAEAEARQKIEACRAANLAIAERLKTEGARLLTAMMTLARDAAQAAAEAQRLNAQLPPGVDPIAVGDAIARDLPKTARDVIATEIQALWVNANGNLLGNQDDVDDNGDGTGTWHINRSTSITCWKRRFTATTFRPPFTPDQAGYFFSALRMPFADRPGAWFDGSTAVLEEVAKMSVEPPPLPKPSMLPARTELVPLDPWPPAGIAPGQAGRNAAA